jgi:hypothetical protein
VPGGLRYAVGRALLEVEAPPFDSADEFSSALSRFEAGDRREQVARLYERASSALLSNCDGPGEHDAASRIERRAHQPSAAELRRQLREADLKLYEAQRLAMHDHRGTRTRRVRRAPIAACMVAGVALVAAGEYAHVGRPVLPASSPQRQPSAATSMPPDQTGPVVSTETVRSATARGATSPPPKTAVAVRRTRASHTRANGVRSDTRAVHDGSAPSGPIRSRSAMRQNVALPQASKREHSDRGVLARIRFEWNNPFH